MRRIGFSYYCKIFSLNKFTSLLQDSVKSVRTRLFQTPDKFILITIFQSFHCIFSLCSIQSSISIFVKLLSNYKVSLSHNTIAIQVESRVRNLLFFTSFQQESFSLFIFVKCTSFAPPLRNS